MSVSLFVCFSTNGFFAVLQTIRYAADRLAARHARRLSNATSAQKLAEKLRDYDEERSQQEGKFVDHLFERHIATYPTRCVFYNKHDKRFCGTERVRGSGLCSNHRFTERKKGVESEYFYFIELE